MRLLRRGVLATLVVSLLATASSACTSAERPPSDEELLSRYSPELWLSSGSVGEPVDVEKVLAERGTEVRRGGPDGEVIARGGDPEAPLTLETLAEDDWSEDDTLIFSGDVNAYPGLAYGRVIRSNGRLLLDYWYAWQQSGGSTVTTRGFELPGVIGGHVWDWERIVVVLDGGGTLVEVVYAAHRYANAVSASRAPRGADGTRPRAYIAERSNAAYPTRDRHPVELPASIGVSALGDVEIYDYADGGGEMLTLEVELRRDWAEQPLYWGQSRVGVTSEGILVDSPRGPDVHTGPGRQATAADLVAKARR